MTFISRTITAVSRFIWPVAPIRDYALEMAEIDADIDRAVKAKGRVTHLRKMKVALMNECLADELGRVLPETFGGNR